ncbi:MAG: TRAP transporter small permease subunit [Rhodospirillales bacterium]
MSALRSLGRSLRPVLDAVYNVCGYIAACFLLVILLIIVVQMISRWILDFAGLVRSVAGDGAADWVLDNMTYQFIGSTNYAGYCMAAASFFAMAYALNNGAHIRVNLVLTRLTGLSRRIGDIWCFSIGAFFAGFFAWYAIRAVYWSHKLHDVSQGQDATPIWIPQLSMAFGTTILAIALVDHLIRVIFVGETDLSAERVGETKSE